MAENRDSVPRLFRRPSPDWVKTWALYRKRGTTPAIRVDGPFRVETREGVLDCPDGYLAVDSNGDPYPIARDVFEQTYTPKEIDGAPPPRPPRPSADSGNFPAVRRAS